MTDWFDQISWRAYVVGWFVCFGWIYTRFYPPGSDIDAAMPFLVLWAMFGALFWPLVASVQLWWRYMA